MKKSMLFGTLAAVAAAGLVYKMRKDGKLDEAMDKASDLVFRSKRDIKNAIAAGKNEAEYIQNRADFRARKTSKS